MNLQAILQLCRIPNVFTAMSNVVAGVVLARGGTFHLSDLCLVAASALFYLSGMVLNDVFDRDVDAAERPDRPIPSGRVSVAGATAFGVSLMIGAHLLLWPMGQTVQLVGVGLSLSILAYDGWLKNTPLGAVSMGLCRGLNVLLGFAVLPWPSQWMWVLPVGLAFYTAIITFLARDEVVGLAKQRSQAAAHMMLALFVMFVGYATLLTPASQTNTFILAAPFLVFLGVRGLMLFRPLLTDCSGPTVGCAIGGGILLMPGIDAAVLACAGFPQWALVALACTLPAMWLKRSFYVT